MKKHMHVGPSAEKTSWLKQPVLNSELHVDSIDRMMKLKLSSRLEMKIKAILIDLAQVMSGARFVRRPSQTTASSFSPFIWKVVSPSVWTETSSAEPEDQSLIIMMRRNLQARNLHHVRTHSKM